MKTKLTKLEKLFEEPDYGIMTATGSLSKMLRGFWRDIGLTHLHINQLIDKWLDDTANEFEQDTTKLNDARGNIRKDNEKDDSTWKIFLRNLRMLRPLEVRFLIRLKFKDGSTFRQIATMQPRSTTAHNSDQLFKDLPWSFLDDDGFVQKDAGDFDDEGIHKSEPDYIPRDICVFDETDDGYWWCSQEDLITHVNNQKRIESGLYPMQMLLSSIIDRVQDTWKDEMATHLKRLANADVSHAIIIYKDKDQSIVADGFHRIIRGYLMGKTDMSCIVTKTLPALNYQPKVRKLKSV